MNIHKNARLTLIRRRELVRDMIDQQLMVTQAAAEYGVTPPTVRNMQQNLLFALP